MLVAEGLSDGGVLLTRMALSHTGWALDEVDSKRTRGYGGGEVSLKFRLRLQGSLQDLAGYISVCKKVEARRD